MAFLLPEPLPGPQFAHAGRPDQRVQHDQQRLLILVRQQIHFPVEPVEFRVPDASFAGGEILASASQRV
jgi:hypothetical protein